MTRDSVGVVLFTRDLRVHDNPTLWHGVHDHDRVVPLFVLDEAILGGPFGRPNRTRFLAESLHDLDSSLTERGGGLVVRRGTVADEVAAVVREVGAAAVHVSGDCSAYAARRLDALHESVDAELVVHHGTVFVVPPGEIVSAGKDHMAVFGAYYRRWGAHDRREVLAAPREVAQPRLARGRIPKAADLCRGDASPELAPGGESEGRSRLATWLRTSARDYADVHDDMGADDTSRLSPYLHFGCLSPREVISRDGVTPEFVRQIAWRDFHSQVLAARPASTHRDYRPRGDRWRDAPEELRAWQDGMTGWPLIDAGMRQLRAEGWMHNRARLIVAAFLTKTLYLDWRLGARHFADLLLDADQANNWMNWQWAAGTGTDSRFNRTYNVTTQARKYDPSGDYVRRYVPELRSIDADLVHEPWRLPDDEFDRLGYPARIVDVAEGNRRFLHARGKD